jgi:hypothetical protein
MSSKISQIFREISEINPPAGLGNLILQKIDLERSKSLQRKIYLSYFGLGGSLAAMLYAILVFGKSFLNSEFWSMLSLAFSDIMVVAAHWNEFADSLMETFPVVNLIAILIPLFTLFLSLNFYLSLARRNNHKLHFN